ncbi:MAG: TetR/AcrR family transcriptional regulator [Woeseiaceae bacterium]
MNGVKMIRARRNYRPRTRVPERYHHGDLRAALIRAADELLAAEGLEGFSLRKAARRAGVSPAAPTHHFGNAAGLLSEVAILGFQELAKHLNVDTSKGTPAQRLRMQGQGYVRFALRYPGRFQLMFRCDLLSPEHAALQEAGARTLAQFEETIRAINSIPQQKPLDSKARAAVLAAWSIVHGFAHLVLDGKITYLHPEAAPDELVADVLLCLS